MFEQKVLRALAILEGAQFWEPTGSELRGPLSWERTGKLPSEGRSTFCGLQKQFTSNVGPGRGHTGHTGPFCGLTRRGRPDSKRKVWVLNKESQSEPRKTWQPICAADTTSFGETV